MPIRVSLPHRPSPRALLSLVAGLLPPLLVLGYLAHVTRQALSDDFVGPHRWDDFKYISRALSDGFDFHVRFRYAHIWGLRGFFTLIEDRQLAAGWYAATMNGALMLAVYALGRRACGTWGAVLSALLVPAFAPLAMFWSTPLCDPPCTLYACLALLVALRYRERGGSFALPLLAGLGAFASIKSKETGIVVVPVLAWLLWEAPAPRRRTLLWSVGGLLLGQVILCIVDGVITGDPFQSVRMSVYDKYVKVVSSLPHSASPSRRVLRRDEWVELFLAPGMREYTVCGVLGLVLGFRRNRALRALAVWSLLSLGFGAWVCFRYSGIDAHVRYLAPFGPALCVGTAALFVHVLSRAAASVPDGDASEGEPMPWWVWSPVALACAAVAAMGLYTGYLVLEDGRQSFLIKRAEFFMYPLVVPMGLAAAAVIPVRALRVLPALAALCAVMLAGQPQIRGYVGKERRNIEGWAKLAKHVAKLPEPKVALYHARKPTVKPQLVEWRIAALGTARLSEIRVRRVRKWSDAHRDELLLVNFHNTPRRKSKRKHIPEEPWRRMFDMRLHKRHLSAYLPTDGD